MKFLLARNANINAADGDGDTPLLLTVVFDQLEVVKVLLGNNADVNLPRRTGATPLYIAAEKGRYEAQPGTTCITC